MGTNDETVAGSAPRTGGGFRDWLGLAVLVPPVVLLALDNSVLFLAAPQLAADLRPGPTELLWILDVYGFVLAGFLVTMGGLADRVGPRRLLTIGAAGFGLASVFAAYASSPELLIAARALLGIAGATMMPSTLSLIRTLFPDPKRRALAIGIWTACFSGGTIIGPVVGGALLESFWWGSVFLLGVPVMVLLLATAPVLLPEAPRGRNGRLDLPSVLLSLAAILPIIYGLKELAKDGPEPATVLAIALGATLGVVFVRRQRRLTNPLLDIGLFRNSAFSAGLLVLLSGMSIIGGIYLLITQYLQLVAELSPLRAGLLVVPAAAGEMAIAVATPLIARRVRPAYVVAAGLATSALGMLVLTQVGPSSELLLMMAGMTIVFIGTSPMIVLSTDLVVGAVPPEKSATAGSMLETSGEMGVALGIATFGSIGGLVYRERIADSTPDRIPTGASEAAGESLHDATVVASQLPTGLAEQLLIAAREAFATGLQTVAGVGAIVACGLAIIAIRVLRQTRPGQSSS
jgi:DHA2 family multidrug resistance protein-like MFS transporter